MHAIRPILSVRLVATLTVLAAFAGAPAPAHEHEHDQDHAQAPAETDAATQAWLEAGTPGPVHAFLAGQVGSWRVETRSWLEPGAPPLKSSATAQTVMILDGRYLKEDFQGDMMGMPFTGMGLTGYDNTNGEVTSIWIDSLSTGTAVLTGTYETPGEPMELTGAMVDPVTGKEVVMRTVSTFISEDEHRFEMYTTMPGLPEMKSMEMVYTRAD